MWLSVPPWAPTGYGTQTSQVVQRLANAGHQVAVSAITGLRWTPITWPCGDHEILIYPGSQDGLNKKTLRSHVEDWAAKCDGDVQVISLFDVWPWIDPSPQYGGSIADFDGLKMAAWVPIDSYPIMPKVRASLERFDVRPIAMSRFGETTLREAGFDPLYAPHAIDTNVYKPHPDRAECKRMLGIDPDRFVVGMVAHNEGIGPSRKAFPAVLQAFSAFHREHPEALLYLHTEVTGRTFNGINLVGLAQHFGIPNDAVVPVNQAAYLAGLITPDAMAATYSALDVLASPSYGEGFGLPIIEAQACGTPVAVSAWTAMPELVGAGWTVGGQPWYNESSGAFWWHADWSEVAAAFEQALEKRDDEDFRAAARSFAEGYDADKVFQEHWIPTLEALGRPREVPALPNRKMKRAARKAGIVS